MEKKKGNTNDRFEIQEMFMAQASKNRCYYGTIKRETDGDGNPVVYGKISINDGYIIAKAGNRDELGKRLDEMVVMILDKGLHSVNGKTTEICDSDFFLN